MNREPEFNENQNKKTSDLLLHGRCAGYSGFVKWKLDDQRIGQPASKIEDLGAKK